MERELRQLGVAPLFLLTVVDCCRRCCCRCRPAAASAATLVASPSKAQRACLHSLWL